MYDSSVCPAAAMPRSWVSPAPLPLTEEPVVPDAPVLPDAPDEPMLPDEPVVPETPEELDAPEESEPPVEGLALGDEDVDPLRPPEVVPAPVPGEPALPLMRPLAFGWRLASLLVPGEVIVEPPLVAPPLTPEPEPGEALGLLDTLACACWLQASKSDWVCASPYAGAQARTAAMPRSAVARVKVAMKLSS